MLSLAHHVPPDIFELSGSILTIADLILSLISAFFRFLEKTPGRACIGSFFTSVCHTYGLKKHFVMTFRPYYSDE